MKLPPTDYAELWKATFLNAIIGAAGSISYTERGIVQNAEKIADLAVKAWESRT